jgi:ABC-2 type transport system permease protein
MNNRLISIVRKEFIQLWRDKRMLAMILVFPLIQLFLLSYIFTTDVRNLPMAVFDQSHSAEARDLLQAYRSTDYFALTYAVNSDSELHRLIEKGEVGIGLIIPPDYASQVHRGQAQVALILDGSDPTIANTALSAARLIAQNYATDLMVERLQRSGLNARLQQPIDVRTTVWYNPDLVSAYFMIPGVIAMILFAITALLTATSVVREREQGTIEQLIVTPIRPWELVVGKILPYVILGLLDTVEVIAIGHFWFGVPVRGSLLLIAFVSILFLASGLGIGLLASTIANTQQEAILTVWMTLLPAIFLSGFLYPMNNMPLLLRWISYAIPMRYFLEALRVLMLKGAGLAAIQNQVIALVLFGFVIMGAAAMRFRKHLD